MESFLPKWKKLQAGKVGEKKVFYKLKLWENGFEIKGVWKRKAQGAKKWLLRC